MDKLFHEQRGRVFNLAYRMLGSIADAEDVSQEAWLRWWRADQSEVANAEAWLVTTTTRLAIDRLRQLRRERDAYPGTWLPEPFLEETPEDSASQANDLSVALMWVLERLGPEERAGFVLRQAFDLTYDEIARILGKSVAACRQTVHRARGRVRQERPRFAVPKEQHRRVVRRFVEAARSGNRDDLQALLAADAEMITDGGGKAPSLSRVLTGAGPIAKLYWAYHRPRKDRLVYSLGRINGDAGLLRFEDGRLESAQSLVTDGERIRAIYSIRNPDKLHRSLAA